ncbi:MAG TPA: RNA-guided pseudouridylation complex pseudouridine synthase subunit Cbf5 [Patescibacteria group bacterium]|nr:RNA-guided pseudouridylation complex pseudouridine synthase subunit Cbf5 [Patescibacteria group bacterium]
MKPDINAIKSQKSIRELLNFGILNIDKPSGPTSFDISDFVRKKLSEIGVKKTSHFGTLDPQVTGVLPIALNRACKLTGFFLGEDKEYIGIMRMHEDISMDEIKKAIKEKFLGNISQKPPVKSRVKRVERQREIKKFELLEKDGKDILFLAEVQGGTYIRKLISDLGDYLKIGAHMLELRRTKAGIFEEKNSINLYEFEEIIEEYKKGNEKKLREAIIPGEVVSEIYPPVEIKDNNMKSIMTGKPISKKDLAKNEKFEDGEIISVFSGNKFIGMYKVSAKEEIFAVPEFVFS